MQNVYIPEWMMDTITRITTSKGDYNDEGDWVPGAETREDIKAFHVPFGSKEIKDYPQGMIEFGDEDIRSKTLLKKKDRVLIDGEEWYIVDRIDYKKIADLKFYIGRRTDKDG